MLKSLLSNQIIIIIITEIVGNNFEAGELGPGTIVGSAAFNLFVITAVCVMSIGGGEPKQVSLIIIIHVPLTLQHKVLMQGSTEETVGWVCNIKETFTVNLVLPIAEPRSEFCIAWMRAATATTTITIVMLRLFYSTNLYFVY